MFVCVQPRHRIGQYLLLQFCDWRLAVGPSSRRGVPKTRDRGAHSSRRYRSRSPLSLSLHSPLARWTAGPLSHSLPSLLAVSSLSPLLSPTLRSLSSLLASFFHVLLVSRFYFPRFITHMFSTYILS